jgi:hypothetical protein
MTNQGGKRFSCRRGVQFSAAVFNLRIAAMVRLSRSIGVRGRCSVGLTCMHPCSCLLPGGDASVMTLRQVLDVVRPQKVVR